MQEGERIKVFGGEQSVKLIIKGTNFSLPTVQGSRFRAHAGKDTTPRITATYRGAEKSLARPTS